LEKSDVFITLHLVHDLGSGYSTRTLWTYGVRSKFSRSFVMVTMNVYMYKQTGSKMKYYIKSASDALNIESI